MKNWQASILVALGLMWIPVTGEAVLHRKGCETPHAGVKVCWDLVADEGVGELAVPYPRIHLLPMARQVAGQPEVWVEMSRTIYRQLLPGRLAEQLVPEWTPAYHLEGAVALSQRSGWPAMMWIAPREMRNSSASSPGLVDWDVYLIAQGRLLRTMRVRVESHPERLHDGLERASAVGGVLAATGGLVNAPLGSAAAVIGTYAMGQSTPPEAGQPLELLTELATRQILAVLQKSPDELPQPRPETGGDPHSPENVDKLLQRPFAAK
ncbi:MAG: hypothetical protein G8237_13360 [Magnetococcales bacterium]|nr:hypothetical protein [Magnetococcales bacterium]NGZ07331.1 hypothetical protein [Magnetococcales bacterium]